MGTKGRVEAVEERLGLWHSDRDQEGGDWLVRLLNCWTWQELGAFCDWLSSVQQGKRVSSDLLAQADAAWSVLWDNAHGQDLQKMVDLFGARGTVSELVGD